MRVLRKQAPKEERLDSTEPPHRHWKRVRCHTAAEGATGLQKLMTSARTQGSSTRHVRRLLLLTLVVVATGHAIEAPGSSDTQPLAHAPALSWEAVVAILAMTGLIAFLTASEVALMTMRRTRLRQLVEDGVAAARPALRLVEEPTQFLATVQTGITFASMFIAAIAARAPMERLALWLNELSVHYQVPWLTHHALGLSLALTILTVGLLELLFGELIPKRIALQRAEQLSLMMAGPIEALSRLTYPLVSVLTRITALASRPFGAPDGTPFAPLTEEEIKEIVEESEKEGVLEEQETEMIHSVLEFTDTVVRTVMVPRIEMVCVEANQSLKDLVEVVLRTGHSRIPIYEGTVDNIVGIVHAKDLLRAVRDGIGERDIRQANVMRSAYYVPETMKVDELLTVLRRRKQQMAIVVDEYGGTAGLVTLEDLLEEIVGPISDEHDVEDEPTLTVVDEQVALVDGRMPLDEVNERLGLHLCDPESETLGGYVFSLLGRVPTVGEAVEQEGVRFEVIAADGRRIARVKITRLSQEGPGPAEGGAGQEE